MAYLGFFLGVFLMVAVFSALIAMTYILARTRVDEAEERRKKAFAYVTPSKASEETAASVR